MNKLKELNTEILHLLELCNKGGVSREEIVIKFERILKDLTVIYGSDKDDIQKLKMSFLKKIFKIEKYKTLNENFNKNIDELTKLRGEEDLVFDFI